MKNFDIWNGVKKTTDNKDANFQCDVREIWWASVGENIGEEICGKNNSFERPVLIIKKFSKSNFFVLPITSTVRKGTYFYNIELNGKVRSVLLHQGRFISNKRMLRRIETVSEGKFAGITAAFLNNFTIENPPYGGNSQAPYGEDILSISNTGGLSSNIHDYNTQALEIHKRNGGKLEVKSKLPLKTKEDLSIAYTPGVAAVCTDISDHPENVYASTLKSNTIAIISDGSAILGLGNLGASASIPVMEGKAAILKEFAGVDAFPICLQSQDTEEIINIIKNIAPVFGGINLEDIASPKCFEIESRLKSEMQIPVMHDDQWGAATVSLTALINSLKLAGKSKDNVKVVLSGVGAAGVATARLLIAYGIRNIIFIDSKGVIRSDRSDLNKEKIELINNTNNFNSKAVSLTDALVGADVFIGLSKPGVLTKEMVQCMAADPIIFALANPVPEIMPEVAKEAGCYIMATGRSDYPNQINNSLVFPGFWKGMLEKRRRDISSTTAHVYDETLFIRIAEGLADMVEELNVDNILPNMFNPKVVDIVYSEVLK